MKLDRGLYFVEYLGSGFTENDGTQVPTGAVKVGRRIENLSDYGKTYEKQYTKGGPVNFEVLCRMNDRDAIDAIEKAARKPLSKHKLKNAKGSTKEWLIGVSRDEAVAAFRKAFIDYFDLVRK
jgi:hypothetical protein